VICLTHCSPEAIAMRDDAVYGIATIADADNAGARAIYLPRSNCRIQGFCCVLCKICANVSIAEFDGQVRPE